MEVFAADIQDCLPTKNLSRSGRLKGSKKVAVKRVSREHFPVRNHALALEEDFVFLKGRDEFYAKVGAMTQEIKILARVCFPLTFQEKLITDRYRNRCTGTEI